MSNSIDRERAYRIYLNDDVQRSKRVARRQESKCGINLGNSILFENDDIPVPASEWFIASDWGVVRPRRLLRASIRDIPEASRGPGSWVVSIQGAVEEFGPPIDYRRSTPMIAVVSYGTGGASHSIEIDAWRSVFAIPADDFTIDVGWSRPGTDVDALLAPTRVPQKVRMTALVHRTTESGESIPTRTYHVQQDAIDLDAGWAKRLPIPNQAVSWTIGEGLGNIYTPTDTPIDVAYLSSLNHNVPPSPTADQFDVVPPDILTAMLRGRCFRECPARARSLSLVFSSVRQHKVTFRLGL